MDILQIGCGGVGKAINEIFALEKVEINKLVILCPEDIPDWVKYDKHIKIALTKDNMKKILSPQISSGMFVIDVSVNVDCIPIMQICKEKQAKYINTSLEDWTEEGDESTFDVDNKKEMHARVLFYRMNKVKKLMQDADATILTDCGANPGLVSSFVKMALKTVAKKYDDKLALRWIKQGKFNKAALLMGLQVIHISELDTQKASIRLEKDTFYNTWSCVGFTAEALDPVSIGYGSHETNIKRQWIKPTDAKDPVVRFMDKRGCDVIRKTYVPDHSGEIHSIEGFVIPHGESYTICKALQYKTYRPSVYYVYGCNPPAVESIHRLKENNYKPLANNHVLSLDEIKPNFAYDSVGVLLFFSGDGTIPKVAHWYGSSLSKVDVINLGFQHSGPTTVQVATSILSAIKWIKHNHNKESLITPEDLNYEYILENSKKYLGKMISKTFEYKETIPLTFDKFN